MMTRRHDRTPVPRQEPETGSRERRPAPHRAAGDDPAALALTLQSRIGNAALLARIRMEDGRLEGSVELGTGRERGRSRGRSGRRSVADTGGVPGGAAGLVAPNSGGSDPGRCDTGESRPAREDLPAADVQAGEDAGGIEMEPPAAAPGQPAPRERTGTGTRGTGSSSRSQGTTPSAGDSFTATTLPSAVTGAPLVLSPEGGAPRDLLGPAAEEFQAGLLRCQEREAACREVHEDAAGLFGNGFFRTVPVIGGTLRNDAEREMLLHARVGRSEDVLGTTLIATLQAAEQAWGVRDEALGRLAASGLADIGEDGTIRIASDGIAAEAGRARDALGPLALGLEARGQALEPGPAVQVGIARVQATRAALGSALDRARARAVDASVTSDREERARIAAFIDLCDDVEKTSVLAFDIAVAPNAWTDAGDLGSDAGSFVAGDLGLQADSAAGLAAQLALRPRLDELQARIGAATALSDTLRTVAEEGDLAGRHAAFEAAVLEWSAGLSATRAGADRQVADLAGTGVAADLAAGRPARGPGGLGQALADLGSAREAAGFATAVEAPLAGIADRLSAFHGDTVAEAGRPAGAVALGPLRRALAREGDLAQVWAREARRLSQEAAATRTALASAGALFGSPEAGSDRAA